MANSSFQTWMVGDQHAGFDPEKAVYFLSLSGTNQPPFPGAIVTAQFAMHCSGREREAEMERCGIFLHRPIPMHPTYASTDASTDN